VHHGDRQDHTVAWPERLLFLGIGVGIGAAAGYLADPDRGRARRTELQQQAMSTATRAADQALDAARDTTQRAVGSAIDAVPEFTRPSDAVLLERVRSQAIGPSDVPNAQLVTTVADGVVELRGKVDTLPQREALLRAVAAVDGVREVRDLTHLPEEPAPTRS
jgi:osmotically-inducible protein OsmY